MRSNGTFLSLRLFLSIASIAAVAGLAGCEPPPEPQSPGNDGGSDASASADGEASEGVGAVMSSLLRCGPGTKACGNSCVSTATCCGGCSGATPVCSNGTCVKKTCAANQALCGGTTCVDTYSSAAHCGASCLKCAGATAECYQGGCVECLSDTDCRTSAHAATLGSQAMCHLSPSHLCGCAMQEAGNVLGNAGFDTANSINNWTTGDSSSSLSWEGGDGFLCQNSGSASMTGFNPLQQCANITRGARYYFGAMYFQASDGVDCSVEYHANSACSDAALGFVGFMGRTTNAWTHLGGPTTAPANASYALVRCAQWDGQSASVDQLYLNSTNDSF